ncbi:MAG TPA: (2Fe-2S)-binding protein [Clostridia bacterium]|jgi:predicted molibdopterin-dependent oxidoreductase YjgC|nr:MAG: Hydrogen cyanide synthase subunit HcnA [Firmicutes bacterium ADurb.Bin248]HOG00269.1 (2Fe-2S)-binding protein [Clostridia bacterium]HOS18999.1 (2Fe-2S)-binding protein [Clostridia bacterium]
MNRVPHHPILGDEPPAKEVQIFVDGRPVAAREGEMIAAALIANGIFKFRYTPHAHKPRGVYCAIGRCTDCVMTVDGVPNIRTCITQVRDGMRVDTQHGMGAWQKGDGHDPN